MPCILTTTGNLVDRAWPVQPISFMINHVGMCECWQTEHFIRKTMDINTGTHSVSSFKASLRVTLFTRTHGRS